ncbi:MAG: hypothetical protein FWE41_00155 [Coriobacteriia bacterium]|nr:hypothetical protein [Coriobacteriia bacterium]
MVQRDGVSVPLWLLSQSGTLTPSLCTTHQAPSLLYHTRKEKHDCITRWSS